MITLFNVHIKHILWQSIHTNNYCFHSENLLKLPITMISKPADTLKLWNFRMEQRHRLQKPVERSIRHAKCSGSIRKLRQGIAILLTIAPKFSKVILILNFKITTEGPKTTLLFITTAIKCIASKQVQKFALTEMYSDALVFWQKKNKGQIQRGNISKRTKQHSEDLSLLRENWEIRIHQFNFKFYFESACSCRLSSVCC